MRNYTVCGRLLLRTGRLYLSRQKQLRHFCEGFSDLQSIGQITRSNNINGSGFSTQLASLLRKGTERGTSGLTCSDESLSAARHALLEATAVGTDSTSPEGIANRIHDHYQSLASVEEKNAFFSVLAGDLSVDHDAVVKTAQQFLTLHKEERGENALIKHEANLRASLSPFYCKLFNMIARLETGIKFLVDIRGDLMDVLAQQTGSSPYLLTEMNNHLREILSQWFTPQLLDLCQVTWESPCDLLEKISTYEAVHRLRHWKDLKHRLGPSRRCFVFMHKAIPREPIVILHAALTTQPSNCIQTLLDRRQQEDIANVSTANFYSISATQRGLSGVELGNFLIRRVVHELQREFPQKLSTFVTLSPIPGFRKWLDSYLESNAERPGKEIEIMLSDLEPLLPLFPASNSPQEALKQALELSSEWGKQCQEQLVQTLKSPLTKLCARYLAVVKRRGNALDPVAHFHLQNGATIGRLNWMADSSSNGLKRSYGLMVNYHYNLPDISKNSDAYRMDKTIAQLQLFNDWLK